MKSKFSWLRQPAALLIILLALSSAAMAFTGLILKYDTGRHSPMVRDTLAIAVPFLFLRGEVPTEELFPEKGLPLFPHPDGGASPEQPGGPNGEEDGKPAEVSYRHVEEDYFDTALFIGDSRSEGMKLYGRLGKADYFATAGMSVFNLLEKTTSDLNFGEQSLYSLLAARQYETIYLSLGINEVGYPRESLEKKFAFIVSELRRVQPESRLILLGNLTVSRQKAENSTSLNLESIRSLNELIASHADNESIFYLDPNPLFADEEGYMRADLTGDGVHPYAKEYRTLAIWLKDYGLPAQEEESETGGGLPWFGPTEPQEEPQE